MRPGMGALQGSRRTSWASLCRLLGGVGLALFFVSAFTPLPNVLSRWLGAHPRLGRPRQSSC